MAASTLGTVTKGTQNSENKGGEPSVDERSEITDKVRNTLSQLMNVSCGAPPRRSFEWPFVVHRM